MNLRQSLIFFGIPGLAVFLLVNAFVPYAVNLGIPLLVSWSIALWLPIIIWFVGVIGHYWMRRRDHNFSERFRFKNISKQDGLLILVGVVLVQIFELLLFPTGKFFAQLAYFTPPDIIPELFSPYFDINNGLTHFFDIPVKGNWWLVWFWLGWLVINIGGEEILWRGYALPLQERIFGRYAWLINGLCWNLLIHFFLRWNFVALMPISLIIPYLVQRQKNTWIGVFIHGIGNGLVLVVLIPAIIG